MAEQNLIGDAKDPGRSASEIEAENTAYLAGKATPKTGEAPSGNGSARSPSSSGSPSRKGSSGRAHPYYKKLSTVGSGATATDASRTVFMALGLSVGVVLLARASGVQGMSINKFLPGIGGKSHAEPNLFTIGIGASLTAIFLLVLAEERPSLAKQVAWLVLLGTVLNWGPAAATTIQKVMKADPSKLPKIGKGK